MRLSEIALIRIGQKKIGRARDFMEEFWAKTQSDPHRRPEERLLVFTRDDYVVISCRVDMNDPNGVHISDMNTIGRGKGWGTKALQWLNDLADKHDVTLSGFSQSYMADRDATVLKQKDLTAWYVRHGYEATKVDRADKITRQPKARS